MTRRNLVILLAAILLIAAIWGTVPTIQARGVTLTVNSTGDLGDFNPGNGVCATAPPRAEGGDECTLRAAIEELNAQGPDVNPHHIEFDIAGSGPFTIMPASALPDIVVPLEIDGETQSGAACPTAELPAELLIVLDGSNAGAGVYGLTLDNGSDGSTVRGLVIGNFSLNGLKVFSNDNNIGCNHVGLAADGFSDMGNDQNGITLNGDGNVVGGAASAQQRNVVAYNGGSAIYVVGDNNFIGNNFIGSHADGMGDGGNDDGVYVGGDNNQIGGPSLIARNLIGGNDGFGIRVNSSVGNVLQGNAIGVARDVTTPLPNGSSGIEIVGSAITNTVGGTAALEANLIANNGTDGIYVDDNVVGMPIRNRIQGNSIFNNTELAIDLGADGVDVNDAGDGDSGENEHQNYPVLLSAGGGSLVVTGTLNSQPNTEYTVDFYRSNNCDPSGYGEGRVYLGNGAVTTDGSGDADFAIVLSATASPGDSITATATDPDGNTSEYSACITVVSPVTPTPTPSATATTGPSPTPTATATNGPSPTPTATPTDGPSPTPTATATSGPSPTPTATLPPASDWLYLPAVQSDSGQ
jgi:CSLREA domain-containing protein